MLDLNFVRANLEFVEEKLRARGADPAALLGDFRALDADRREAITIFEQSKARLNNLSQQVGALKKAGQDATALMDETRALKKFVDEQSMQAVVYDLQLQVRLQVIPNLTRDEVPVGKSEADNVAVKFWGEKPAFDFEAKPHWELGESLGILDLERAAKLSGARFAVYMGAGARLERALISFMLDTHTEKHGYTEVLPPFMVNRQCLIGTGQLPKFAEDLFRCADSDLGAQVAADEAVEQAKREFGEESEEFDEAVDLKRKSKDKAIFNDHWLIPTAEVPVTNLYRDEILDEARLPICLTAYTPCFRAEAGAAGKDTRGIIRQHQFQKVEMVKFTRPEESDADAVARGEFKDNDHWLIPTAEVPVTNLYRDEILDEARLPISLTAYTPCFRAEAGAAGKDTRGIIRQHQFQKVELVKFTRPEESDAEHEKLTRNAEEILEALKLPYRRVLLSTGDTGFSSAKTYDLEVWLPGQNLYREISSCSNFDAFQARRANIRYRPSGPKAKPEFVHTLNGSGLAVGRTWLAILENYQQADGSVEIPEAIRPYMGGLDKIVRES